MKAYKTKGFGRWAAKEKLSDQDLRCALDEMAEGLIDAVLGGQLVKKRIGGAGRGKSGAFRTIIAYRAGDRAFFILGFSKNEKDNVTAKELKVLKMLSKQYFGYGDDQLGDAVRSGALLEVICNE